MQVTKTTILTEDEIDNLWNTTLDKVNGEEVEQDKKTEEKEKQSKEVLNNNSNKTEEKDKKNDIPKNFGGF